MKGPRETDGDESRNVRDMAPRRGQETGVLTKGHLETERHTWKEIGLEQAGLQRNGPGTCPWVPEREGEGMPGVATTEAKAGGSRATACPACLQVQEVQPITSYDAAGSFLLLGCSNGSIYYVGE